MIIQDNFAEVPEHCNMGKLAFRPIVALACVIYWKWIINVHFDLIYSKDDNTLVYSNGEEESDLKRLEEGFVFLHAEFGLIGDVTSP